MANNSRGNIQYSIKDLVGLGELSISDEVLVVIAALATTEVLLHLPEILQMQLLQDLAQVSFQRVLRSILTTE